MADRVGWIDLPSAVISGPLYATSRHRSVADFRCVPHRSFLPLPSMKRSLQAYILCTYDTTCERVTTYFVRSKYTLFCAIAPAASDQPKQSQVRSYPGRSTTITINSLASADLLALSLGYNTPTIVQIIRLTRHPCLVLVGATDATTYK